MALPVPRLRVRMDRGRRLSWLGPISTIALSVLLAVAAPAANAWAQGLSGASFVVLDPDNNQVIGAENFKIEQVDGKAILVGRGHFQNGESDLERDELAPPGNGQLPLLVKFEHSFFNPDGSPKIAGYADTRSGKASCTSYEGGQPTRHDSQLSFPADTYAGASIVVALQDALKAGARDFSFHVFDCTPDPAVAAVQLTSVDNHESWDKHPGDLAQAKLTADLGTFGNLISGVLPHRNAWFDPSAGWEYVGGRIQRYFAKGPQIVLVRRPRAQQTSSR